MRALPRGVLAAVPFTASATTFYWMHLDVATGTSDTMRASIWADGIERTIIAGLTMISPTVVMVLTGPLAGRLTNRMGSRSILMLGFMLFAAGIAGVALVEPVTSTSLTVLLPLAVVGLSLGCIIVPLTTEAMREVPH